MSHYLLRLCIPNPSFGQQAQNLAEVHKDLPRAEYGWSRQLHGNKAMYVLLRVCALPDEDCVRYEAWRSRRTQHEDDVEAERLRSEDAKRPSDAVARDVGGGTA